MIKAIIDLVRNSQLTRNALWMFLGQGLRVVIQAIYFILIARSLGSQGYGAFVGVCAFVGILAPFAGLGSGNLLIKNVARNPESFGRYWGYSLLMTIISSALLLVIVLSVSRVILPKAIPITLVFVVSVSDLLFFRILIISAQAFKAFQRLKRTAQIEVIPNILRLVCIAGLSIYIKAPTPLIWGYLYFITTMISSLIGVWLVHKELGRPIFTLIGMKEEKAEGFYFSVSLSAQSVYNDIDKAMLSRFSTLGATGIYSAAYRIIDISFTPIRSLLHAAYARFFQHGERGIDGSFGFAKKLFPIAGVYGLLVGVLIILAAPAIPFVLGVEYNDTAITLRWLAPLPFLKAIHYFAADTMTGAGYQGARSVIQVLVGLFNVGINLWLIPAYSWRGAAWASIASDGLLSILLCLVVLYITRRKRTEKMLVSSK